jgi:hypothetical protein
LSGPAKTFRIRDAHEDAHCMDLVHRVALSRFVPLVTDITPVTRVCPVF